MEYKCRICGNSKNNKTVNLKSTLYGTKGSWNYVICNKCGCLQIEEFPENMSKYYSTDFYYSMNTNKLTIKDKLLREALKYEITGKSFWGRITELLYPVDYKHFRLIKKNDLILDVGCGDGSILNRLSTLGFNNLTGVDPFISEDIKYDNGVCIYKSQLTDFKPDTKYKMITFNHSLEHVSNNLETLAYAKSLLKKDGYIVVKLPFFSKYYWEKYGTYLFTLDPPRHYFIHTYNSLMKLANDVGISLVGYSTESDPAIPVMANNAKKGNTEKNNGAQLISGSIMSILTFNLRKKLDKEKDGAVATFIFKAD